MRRRGVILLGSVMLAFLSHSIAFASEVDLLLNKLVDKGILTVSEAQEVRNEIGAESGKSQEQQKAFVKDTAKEVVPAWTQAVSLNGDMRLRNEYRDRTANIDGNRQRIRFRLGMKAKVNDELEVGARFATGSASGDMNTDSQLSGANSHSHSIPSDPVSTNQTLSDSFAKKNFNLDQAYVKYSPVLPLEDVSVSLLGGIFDNPFVSTPLVWDSDLTFGGGAMQLKYAWNEFEPFLNLGVFPIDSDGFGSDAPSLWAAQGGLTYSPGFETGVELFDGVKLKGALAYYDYLNVAKHSLINTQNGNDASGTATVSDFNELNPYIELSSSAFGMPVSLWSDWVHNTALSDNNDGYQLGVKLGKAATPWSLTKGWEAGYFYERLEPNAVFDAFTDSDFGGGGTNHKGNVFYLTLATLKNSSVTAKYYNATEVTRAKNHEDRFQVDWLTKF
jgi:hypothetical protein